MINLLHSKIFRPENGWDPVPNKHIYEYANTAWNAGTCSKTLDTLEEWMEGMEGKRILDLGGGPGQYSVAFAKRKANVTWFDVSEGYRKIAATKANAEDVKIRFKIGYLDDAAKCLGEDYDLVFNRVCWYYAVSDYQFATTVYKLVRPGGVGYIDCHPAHWANNQRSVSLLIRTWLNSKIGIKIGHPFPPRGRIARLVQKKPIEKILIDYSLNSNDKIIFRKPAI